jgi:hypothetical protein
MILADVGVPSPLQLQLTDGAEDKGVRARVRRSNGELLGTVDLGHIAEGCYGGSFTFPDQNFYYATFTVYTSPSFSLEDKIYEKKTDTYRAIIPTYFGPDISNLATKADVSVLARIQVVNKMSTTFNDASGEQEVIVWSEKDRRRVLTAEDCHIWVKDNNGAIKWAGAASTPNADGIFKFISPISMVVDSNYYIVMTIKVEGIYVTSQQAFVTLG